MKTITLFFLLWLATSCATVAVIPPETTACTEPPVYYTGNDEPAAYGLFLVTDEPVSVSSQQLQSAAPSPVERAGGEVVSAGEDVSSAGCATPPVYFTGNDEPAAYGLFLVTDEPNE
jgi:hypothetical protein